VSTRAWTAAVAALAGLLTLLTSVTSVVDLAYESAPLHMAVETAAALISLLAGQLILGRYTRSTQLAVAQATAAAGRHGFRGMAERVEGIGGDLAIDSTPGRGTQVRVVVE
jgi:hypothetical protein